MADPHPTGLLGSGQELNMIDFNLSLIDWKEGAGGPWAGEGHELTCLFQRSPCCCEESQGMGMGTGAGAEAGRAEREGLVWVQAQPSAGSQWKGVTCAPLAVVEEPGKEECKWLKDLRFLLSLQSHGPGSKSELRRQGGVARRDGVRRVAGPWHRCADAQ